MNRTLIARSTSRAAGLAAVVALLVPACAPQGGDPGPDTAQGAGGSEDPFGHVHGLGVDPGTDELVLATHHGLFALGGAEPEPVGPVNDYMGFAVAGPGHYYASGHPGPDSELPDPLGLVESTDGGRTWQELSRQGESDFHAMAVSSEGVVGFDGALRFTADGEEWTQVQSPLRPVHLAGSADSAAVLATTEEGVQRSVDGGLTWDLPADAPVLLVTAFAGPDTAVGVAPDGTVHVSRDAGLTWATTGGQTGRPAAVAAAGTADDLRVWVATDEGLESSQDGGATFSTAVPAGEH